MKTLLIIILILIIAALVVLIVLTIRKIAGLEEAGKIIQASVNKHYQRALAHENRTKKTIEEFRSILDNVVGFPNPKDAAKTDNTTD